MTKEKIYRNEYKYIISSQEVTILRKRIQEIAIIDSHAKEKSFYNVRSLYFDDYFNSCYFDNESGVDNRDKYRARIYDGNAEKIQLEIKHKEHGLGYKDSTLLFKDEFEDFLSGKVSYTDNNVLNRYIIRKEQNGLRPVVIVDYDRIPYVYKIGNVRITFDLNISSSSWIDSFCEKEIDKRPIMPLNQHIMEVKFDGFLPDVIKQVLNIGELRRTSYSKYYLCRKYKI